MFPISKTYYNNSQFLDLAGHFLTTFEGINLIIKRTLVSSFKESVEMPELEEIDFTETPLSRQSYCREMRLFALGFHIQIINLFPITQTEKKSKFTKFLQKHSKCDSKGK